MNLEMDLTTIIGTAESETLEYKAVLPPPRGLAQMIASFANTNGGFIVLGVTDRNRTVEIIGLSSDFYAAEVVQKAVTLLSPQTSVSVEHLIYQGKRIFVIKIQKGATPVALEGKIYVRQGDRTVQTNPDRTQFKSRAKTPIETEWRKLEGYKNSTTASMSRFVDHYQSVLSILDDVENIIFPSAFNTVTTVLQGKILSRILFSSCADSFESYLSDLLYEIYLANPATLKSDKTVTVKEVLNCTDMQEFIDLYARKKISKLQRGSVKGFISENQQIADLNILDQPMQDDIERTLQIRHLYAHRNGIVDEKFLSFFPGQFRINEEHNLTAEELVAKMASLADTVYKLDVEAIRKHNLATVR